MKSKEERFGLRKESDIVEEIINDIVAESSHWDYTNCVIKSYKGYFEQLKYIQLEDNLNALVRFRKMINDLSDEINNKIGHIVATNN